MIGATDAARVALLHWQTVEAGAIKSVKVDSEDRRIVSPQQLPGAGDTNIITRQFSDHTPAKSFKASSEFVEMPLSHRAAYPDDQSNPKGRAPAEPEPG